MSVQFSKPLKCYSNLSCTCTAKGPVFEPGGGSVLEVLGVLRSDACRGRGDPECINKLMKLSLSATFLTISCRFGPLRRNLGFR